MTEIHNTNTDIINIITDIDNHVNTNILSSKTFQENMVNHHLLMFKMNLFVFFHICYVCLKCG